MAYIPPTVTTYHAQFMRAGAPLVMRGIVSNINLSGPERSETITKLGAKYVRLRFRWSDYEPQRGQYNTDMFTRLDTALRQMRSDGTQVLIDFHPGKLPSWVADRDDVSGRWTNAGFRADYLSVMSYLIQKTQKYKNVWGYEVWNEPSPGGNGPTYTQSIVRFDTWAVNHLRPLDAKRALVVMLRGGWDRGLLHANMSGLNQPHVVLDLHDQWCGCWTHSLTPDGETELHPHAQSVNQYRYPYAGTVLSQVNYLQTALNRWRKLYHRPLMIGEFEVREDDSNGRIYQAQMFKVFASLHLSAFRWVGLTPWQVIGTSMEAQLRKWLTTST